MQRQKIAVEGAEAGAASDAAAKRARKVKATKPPVGTPKLHTFFKAAPAEASPSASSGAAATEDLMPGITILSKVVKQEQEDENEQDNEKEPAAGTEAEDVE